MTEAETTSSTWMQGAFWSPGQPARKAAMLPDIDHASKRLVDGSGCPVIGQFLERSGFIVMPMGDEDKPGPATVVWLTPAAPLTGAVVAL